MVGVDDLIISYVCRKGGCGGEMWRLYGLRDGVFVREVEVGSRWGEE